MSEMPSPLPVKPQATLAALAQLNMGRVLRPLVNLATAISFYFHLRQFLSSAYVLRFDPDIAYVILLTAYAGHREIRRWSQDPEIIQERARRGELFVVGWWSFYFVTLTAANHVERYTVPEGLLSLCIQMTTIFFGTLASQQIYKGRRAVRPSEGFAEEASLEYQALEQIRRSPMPVQSGDLEIALGVSRSSIYRLTRQLLAKGQIEWTGAKENDPEGGFRPKK